MNLHGRARRPPQKLLSEDKGGDAAAGEHRNPVDLKQDVADMNLAWRLAWIPAAAGWRRPTSVPHPPHLYHPQRLAQFPPAVC